MKLTLDACATTYYTGYIYSLTAVTAVHQFSFSAAANIWILSLVSCLMVTLFITFARLQHCTTAHEVQKIALSLHSVRRARLEHARGLNRNPANVHRFSGPLSYLNSRMRLKRLESKSFWAHVRI